MKIEMMTFLAAAMALAMAGCSENGPETAAQYPLERFTLQVGANIYHANIDQEAGTVTVGQIKYGGQVTAVGCYLADGAQISPNPQDFVGDWPERQEFTVTSGGKETVYTVILSAYEGKFPGAQGEIIFFDDFDQADGLDMDCIFGSQVFQSAFDSAFSLTRERIENPMNRKQLTYTGDIIFSTLYQKDARPIDPVKFQKSSITMPFVDEDGDHPTSPFLLPYGCPLTSSRPDLRADR